MRESNPNRFSNQWNHNFNGIYIPQYIDYSSNRVDSRCCDKTVYSVVLVLLGLSIDRGGELLRRWRLLTTSSVSGLQDHFIQSFMNKSFYQHVLITWSLQSFFMNTFIQLHVLTCVDWRPPSVGLWDAQQRSWRAINSALRISFVIYYWQELTGVKVPEVWVCEGLFIRAHERLS